MIAMEPQRAASEIAAAPPCRDYVSSISYDMARRFLVMAVEVGAESILCYAASTPPWVPHNVRALLQRPFRLHELPPREVAHLIERAYAAEREAGSCVESDDGLDVDLREVAASDDHLMEAAERDLLSTDGKALVVSLVDRILFDALRRRASDVHVQPLPEHALLRVRVDGVLHDVRTISPTIASQIVARIKVIGRLDVAEHRIPQDGRASVTIGRLVSSERGAQGREVDLRISTLPTSHGERVVVRLLDKASSQLARGPHELEMPMSVERGYLQAASRSSGVVLVTGPTGSGKTTTLYATLQWIASRCDDTGRRLGLNVMTIEEPVEYELSRAGVAISQAQVNRKKGVTFASGLRHILRQDPDVIMVGEIRDEETARIAIQASLTGHVVFSTVHTNDAVGTVSRMLDLGIEPYLLASSLSGVLAQRLVRTLHTPCGGAGCEACFGSGFLGRRGIFEWLAVEEGVRNAILCHAAPAELLRTARQGGLCSMHEHGEQLVWAGITTIDEVRRVALGIG